MSIKDKIPHQKLTLDVNKNDCLSTLEMKQGDKLSRLIDITLVASGEFIDLNEIATGATAKIIASMDGELRQNSTATINSDGTVTVEMDENALGEAGVLDCEIRITDSNDAVLSSALFLICVGRSAIGMATKILDILKGLVKTKHIEDKAITTDKLADSSVTADKIEELAINPEKLDRDYLRMRKPETVLGESFHHYLISNIEEPNEPFMKVFLFGSRGDGAMSIVGSGRCIGYYVSNTEFWLRNLHTGSSFTVTFDSNSIIQIEKQKVGTDGLEEAAVTPEKLSEVYWKKSYTADAVTSFTVLFDKLEEAINNTGTINVMNVDIQAATPEGEEYHIKGFCLTYSLHFENDDMTVYLINTTTGRFWKIDRIAGEGYKIYQTSVDSWERRLSLEPIETYVDLFEYVKPLNEGGTINLLNLNILTSSGYITGMYLVCSETWSDGRVFMYLNSLGHGDGWKIVKDADINAFTAYHNLDGRYLKKVYTEYGQQVKSFAELFEMVGYISMGGNIGIVNLWVSDSDTDTIVEDGYIEGEFMAVGSSQHVNFTVYLRNLGNNDCWSVTKNSDGTYIATRVKDKDVLKLMGQVASISVVNAGAFNTVDELSSYGFEEGKIYMCYFAGAIGGLVGSEGTYYCTFSQTTESRFLKFSGGFVYTSGKIHLDKGIVAVTYKMLKKNDVFDKVMLADQVSGKTYSLYISDGELMIEKVEE